MTIPPKVRRILIWVGYPTAYLVLFAIFAYCTFPYDRLKHRLETGFNAAQQTSPDASHLQIGEATWSWRFPGVVLEDINLIPPLAKVLVAGETPSERPTIHADKVFARVAPLSMLFGTTDVTYDVDGFGGTISGTLTISGESKHLVAEFEGVDPGQLPGVVESLELPLSGVMMGKIDLRLPEGKISAAEGVVDIEISDLKIGDGKTKIRGLFALPTLDAGTMKLKATATQGKVKIEQFETKGADIEASGEGRLRLRDTLGMSMVEQLSLNYKFSDKYRDKDDTTRSLLGKPGDSAPALMDLDPKVKRAKQADDSYSWRVTGSFSRLTFTPALGTSKPGTSPRGLTRPAMSH